MTENSMSEDHVHTRPMAHAPVPDAHGQAALLLAESMLHALLDAQILTLDEVIGAVVTAAEVKADVADELGESTAKMEQSLALLSAIKASFGTGSKENGLHSV